MHGYQNLFSDVKLAFKDLLASGSLALKEGEPPSGERLYHVILESEYQYLSLMVEGLSVIPMLVEKTSRKFIYIKELLTLINVDFDEQVKIYHDVIYDEVYNMNDFPIKGKVALFKEHICLGQLYTYAKLIETVLYSFVFDSKESWIDLAEKNKKKVYVTKMDMNN